MLLRSLLFKVQNNRKVEVKNMCEYLRSGLRLLQVKDLWMPLGGGNYKFSHTKRASQT